VEVYIYLLVGFILYIYMYLQLLLLLIKGGASHSTASSNSKPSTSAPSQASDKNEEVRDYPHYNARLTINDFDLLKVIHFVFNSFIHV